MIWAAQRGNHSSRSRITPGLKQPTRGSERLALASGTHTGRASPPLLFGLAPRGVFRAPDVAIRAVGSYPTFSPLPNALDRRRQAPGFSGSLSPRCKHHRRSILCGTFRGRVARHAFAHVTAQPPGVTRRVALPWPTLASSPQLESGLSSRPDFSGPAITRLTRHIHYTTILPRFGCDREAAQSAGKVARPEKTVCHGRVRDHLPGITIVTRGVAKAILLQDRTIGPPPRYI
jgi:hypothetical protein